MLKTFSNLVAQTDPNICRTLILRGLLNLLSDAIESSEKMQIEAMFALSNIAADSEWGCQAVMEHRVFEKLLVCTRHIAMGVRKEAVITLANLIVTCNIDYL
jgi:hypothetical protein